MSLLEVTGLNAYYADSHILFDVAMRVERNEVVALLGRNGAGKSTTLKSLMGVVTPRGGKVVLDGADLAGSSVGGSFAAEAAAIWPAAVRRLALIAPWGLFDDKEPMTDPWAQRAPDVPGLLCADPERWNQLKAEPEGANSPEWPIVQTRANEAAARAFWPLGNTRLEKRLPLIEASTLLIWGEQDRIMPRGYADRFAAAIAGRTEITTIPGAGHLAELDKPDEVAAVILHWTA